MKKVTGKDIVVLLGIFLLIVCVNFIGGFFTKEGLYVWYQGLEKAPWNPPDFVFGPVWAFLYIMIALSVWTIYLSKGKKELCYILFGLQLFFNVVWTICFFAWQSPLLALIDIVILDVLVLFTIIAFSKVSRVAAWLLVPYFFWILYASSLNIYIYVVN
ncbi:tryptophan-rich sensory protein [bacterium]|nr:tryptophan-rich sensory protein [bacterium]